MNFAIKPKMFFDSMAAVMPSQPQVFDYGDRPQVTFEFLPNIIHAGDLLVFAVDNDMTFYDSAPENILHSATCMVVVKHAVTAEEATAGSVTMTVETRTIKFRDVVNGKVRPVDVQVGLYLKTGEGQNVNYALLAKGRGVANGIIADYDSLPEPITTDKYYDKDEIDAKLAGKADAEDLTSHTSDTDVHVTVADKTAWDSKADLNDIGSATVTITQGGVSKGAFSVNATDDLTIDINDGAQADWTEESTQSPAYIQHKPSIYTQSETDTLLSSKADVATTIAGYGITDAYTKTEIDTKISSVYRYKGSVSAYSDLPTEDQEVGDVYNVATADAQHGIKAGDNVAWNGSAWDTLAGEIDLSGYLEKPATGSASQVLTKTSNGHVWADAPTELPSGGYEGQVLTKGASAVEWADAEPCKCLCFTAVGGSATVALTMHGYPNPVTLETSTDGHVWTAYTVGDTITLANAGAKVYFRGNNSTFSSNSANGYTFEMTGTIAASGNVMSLLDKTCKLLEFNADGQRLQKLFYGCASLTSAPELPALKLSYHTYNNMFVNCTGLTVQPDLPATTLMGSCYANMFQGCTGLTEAKIPQLTTVVDSAFYSMYQDCTGLTEVVLPARHIGMQSYQTMFNGCSNLNYVKVAFENWNSGTINWLNNVAETGTFICPSTLEIASRNASTVPAGWTVVRSDSVQSDWEATGDDNPALIKNKPDLSTKLDAPTTAGTAGQVLQKTSNGTEWADAVDADTITAINNLSAMLDSHIGAADSTCYFCIVATRDGQAISIGNDGQWATGTVLEYSIDKTNWFEFNPVTTAKTVLLNTGMKMYLRGNNNLNVIPHGCHPFQGDWILDGDMKSLWSKTLEPEYAITDTYNWFSNSSILGFGTNFAFPSFDSVTTMQGMFGGCTSLVSLPSGFNIPSNVADCSYIFKDCTSLTSLPSGFSIPSSVTNCSYMFHGCTSLTSLPSGFTIPSSVTNCSNMFNNCTNLVSLPSGFSIPSSVTNCSSMFSGSLKGGEIPAPPANTTNLNWYAAFGGGTSNPSTLAVGWKVPDGCTQCSYALHSRGLTSLPDGFQIPASITDDGRAFNGGGNAVTTFGNNVSFLKTNASWHNDYIQFDTVTTIGNNFTLMCDNAPSTDPYVCFPHLTSLGTNCNINGTITNPA